MHPVPVLPLMFCHPPHSFSTTLLRTAAGCIRLNTTDATANTSIKNCHPNDSHQSIPIRQDNILELTQTLLSSPRNSNNYLEQMLDHSRRDKNLLRKMKLTPDEARDMFILPQALLNNVHSAIMHFSKQQNFQGMVITWKDDESTNTQEASIPRGNKKVPGPMICAKLLELIGIPQIHASLASQSDVPSGNTASIRTVVHSSQIDQILECCLETTTALSRSCQTGKYSLLGSDFSWQSAESVNQFKGVKKTAAQLCEAIWRSVWNLQIKYTTSRRKTVYPISPRIRIGRIGSIGNVNSFEEYLSGMRDGRESGENNLASEPYTDALSAINDSTTSLERTPWSTKDQRRYDKSVLIFNTVLASHAKLASSASGARPEVRRETVQKAEQLLLEVLSKKGIGELEPSPSTILQFLEPDVVSFNTILKAWSEFSPKQKVPKARHDSLKDAHVDKDLSHTGTVVAGRTESILEQMQSLWDEERSTRTTLQSMRFAWEGHGEDDGQGGKHAPPPSYSAIAPNTSSYNSVLNAWSRCSDTKAATRALQVYRSMISRSNVACHARCSLALKRPLEENASPDSRTFVHLLQSLQNLSLSVGFRDAFDAIDLVINSVKQWDKQIDWSAKKGIAPLKDAVIINVFSLNTLITTLSKLPRSWEENCQCCLRIDNIIDNMSQGTSSVRPNAAVAWVKCAAHAEGNQKRLQFCAQKSGEHIDAFLMDSMQSPGGNNISDSGNHYILAISDAIELYGRAGMPSKADALFRRAKSCNLHSLGMLSTVIDALCNASTGDIAYVDKAKQYLLDFELESMKICHLLVPDMKYTNMYNTIISGYLHCSMKERGLKQAKAILTHMISSHESNPRHIARPNTTTFATVMSALAQRGDNTRLLEELLKKMEALNQRRKIVIGSSMDSQLAAKVAPNIVVYNILLKSYARSHDEDSLQSAMKLLARMEADPTIKPDIISRSYISELLSRKDGGTDISGNLSPSDSISGNPDLVNLDSGNFHLEDLDWGNIHLEDLNLNGKSQHPTSKSLTSIINGKLICVVNLHPKALETDTQCSTYSTSNDRDNRGSSKRCCTT